MIIIKNKGQDLVDTDYWNSMDAQKGYFYLSWNAGAARLLVPDSQVQAIKEMKTAKYVIISRGKYEGHEGLELLFEDESDSPYVIQLDLVQTDRLIPASDQGGGFIFTVWTKDGKKLSLPAKYRVVNTLPYLGKWVEH